MLNVNVMFGVVASSSATGLACFAFAFAVLHDLDGDAGLPLDLRHIMLPRSGQPCLPSAHGLVIIAPDVGRRPRQPHELLLMLPLPTQLFCSLLLQSEALLLWIRIVDTVAPAGHIDVIVVEGLVGDLLFKIVAVHAIVQGYPVQLVGGVEDRVLLEGAGWERGETAGASAGAG